MFSGGDLTFLKMLTLMTLDRKRNKKNTEVEEGGSGMGMDSMMPFLMTMGDSKKSEGLEVDV